MIVGFARNQINFQAMFRIHGPYLKSLMLEHHALLVEVHRFPRGRQNPFRSNKQTNAYTRPLDHGSLSPKSQRRSCEPKPAIVAAHFAHHSRQHRVYPQKLAARPIRQKGSDREYREICDRAAQTERQRPPIGPETPSTLSRSCRSCPHSPTAPTITYDNCHLPSFSHFDGAQRQCLARYTPMMAMVVCQRMSHRRREAHRCLPP